MENCWQEWAVCLPVVLVEEILSFASCACGRNLVLCLPVVLVEEILSFVQECINITKKGKT
jgi:hypothetical protein